MNLQQTIIAAEQVNSVNDLLVQIKDGIMKCHALSIDYTTLVSVGVPTTLPNTDIPIINIEKVKGLLKRFDTDMNVKVLNGKLIVSKGSKRGWVKLGELSAVDSYNTYISKKDALEKQASILPQYAKITADVSTLRNILTDTKVVDNKFIRFKGKDSIELSIVSDGIGIEYDISNTCTVPTDVKFGDPFHKIVKSTFEKTFDMYLKTGAPMYIKGSNTQYIVAPVITENE